MGTKLVPIGISTAGIHRYYSVQNLLSSRLISKNLKIKIHKTVILPVVLYGCESESPKGIDQLGDLGAGGRIIIK
jgi:hypothetical protein